MSYPTGQHAVYAVLDTIHGPHRVRVSRATTWCDAVDFHEALHGHETADGKLTYDRPVSYPGYTVYGRPVKYLCVRACADPAWPATRPVLSITSD